MTKNTDSKGISPFYPGQPVPVEMFVGRSPEIERISRSIKQVSAGKPQAIFLTGDYGIGKSSLAHYMRFFAEKEHNIFGIHVLMGSASSLDDLAIKTVESVLKSNAYTPSFTEKARDFLSKYVGKQGIFGISIDFKALKADGPDISSGFLPFLKSLLERLKEQKVKGIFLILDEINGMAKNPQFAHFIKELVDANALQPKPLPLLLMLCGVDDRRREMIECHEPIERIFDIVEIEPMDEKEMKAFFISAFKTQDIDVDSDAMSQLCRYSAGFPKLMHIVGDETYWANNDLVIDNGDAFEGIFNAAENIGKKFVDTQVLKALKSKDYHSIIENLGRMPDMSFAKVDLESLLTATEKKKLNNFLQRMKKLDVLISGDTAGEYVFNSRLVKLYLKLISIRKKK